MLIFTRYINESFFIIGEKGEIKITLLDIRGRNAKIGITAPKDVPIHREEVLDRINREIAKEETKMAYDSQFHIEPKESEEEGNK